MAGIVEERRSALQTTSPNGTTESERAVLSTFVQLAAFPRNARRYAWGLAPTRRLNRAAFELLATEVVPEAIKLPVAGR